MNGSEDAFTTIVSETATTQRRHRLQLRVVSGVDHGTSLDFEDSATIGRHRLADLVLTDARVSGLHCRILADDQIRVCDLGSTNGTFLGRYRVLDAVVPIGETITVGDDRISISLQGETYDVALHP